jgi:hypothetical protein
MENIGTPGPFWKAKSQGFYDANPSAIPPESPNTERTMKLKVTPFLVLLALGAAPRADTLKIDLGFAAGEPQ